MSNKIKYGTIFYNKRTNQFCHYIYKGANGWVTVNAGTHPFEECILLNIEQCKRLILLEATTLWAWNSPTQEETNYILNNVELCLQKLNM